jgi:hypothetical protein
MNCFNIREVQALLKGRFFSDLINTHEHHQFLDKTAIGLRYKTNNIDVINPNMLMFYRNGLHFSADSKIETYSSNLLYLNDGANSGFFTDSTNVSHIDFVRSLVNPSNYSIYLG